MKVTSDISKMKRVTEVKIKRDDTQYELNLGSRNMPGPRKGLYDDRPIEHEYCGQAGCPSAPHLFNERMAVAEATVEASKATKEEKEAYEKDLKKRTAEEFNLRSRNMAPVRPEGPYPDNISEAEMLVKAQDFQRGTIPDELSAVTNELIRLTEKLKETPIGQLFDFKEIKAQLDKLEALVATSPADDYCCGKHEREKTRPDRNKAQTRFGRVYYGSTGETIPPILTKEEWDTLKNGIKDSHAADPAPTPNDGRSDDDLCQNILTEKTLMQDIADAEAYKKSLMKDIADASYHFYDKAVKTEELCKSEQEWYEKAHEDYRGIDLAAGKDKTVYTYKHDGRVDKLDLHDAPMFRLVYWRDKFRGTREQLEKQGMPNKIKPRQLWEAEIDALKSMEVDLTKRIWMCKAVSANPHEWPGAIPSGECIGIQPPGILPNGEVQPSEPWPRTQKQQAKYEAQAEIRAEIRAEQKKRKVYKVIAVVSKVIIGSLLIYIGLIIMENILAGKPISTYLNRVLIGE